MNEDRLRQIVASTLGTQDVEDAEFDSHMSVMLMLAIEPELGRQFNDDELGMLTSWDSIRRVVLAPHYYKALVLDADGTLWGGILGEGGATMDDRFTEAQQTYRKLAQRGVLLCLATKNNLTDVKEALSRDGMALSYTSFVTIEAGWVAKPDMLRSIAGELNIGLDAIVFVDDSTFECESVRTQLPEVHVVQVPADLDEYPRVAREVAALFPEMVDTNKTEEYRALAAAEATRPEYANEAEFLASLDMQVWVNCNRPDEIPRIAELCRKANQFNLTTKRYVEADIRVLMDEAHVYSIHYADRFGDQGIVGVVVIQGQEIDTFILSCRILGRGVERKVWDLIETPDKPMYAEYIPTAKNGQVSDLWYRLGMNLIHADPDGSRRYAGWPHG